MYQRDDSGAFVKPYQYREFLAKEANAVRPMTMYQDYLMSNPLFGGAPGDEFILRAPPVKRLYAIYGILSPLIVLLRFGGSIW